MRPKPQILCAQTICRAREACCQIRVCNCEQRDLQSRPLSVGTRRGSAASRRRPSTTAPWSVATAPPLSVGPSSCSDSCRTPTLYCHLETQEHFYYSRLKLYIWLRRHKDAAANGIKCKRCKKLRRRRRVLLPVPFFN